MNWACLRQAVILRVPPGESRLVTTGGILRAKCASNDKIIGTARYTSLASISTAAINAGSLPLLTHA